MGCSPRQQAVPRRVSPASALWCVSHAREQAAHARTSHPVHFRRTCPFFLVCRQISQVKASTERGWDASYTCRCSSSSSASIFSSAGSWFCRCRCGESTFSTPVTARCNKEPPVCSASASSSCCLVRFAACDGGVEVVGGGVASASGAGNFMRRFFPDVPVCVSNLQGVRGSSLLSYPLITNGGAPPLSTRRKGWLRRCHDAGSSSTPDK